MLGKNLDSPTTPKKKKAKDLEKIEETSLENETNEKFKNDTQQDKNSSKNLFNRKNDQSIDKCKFLTKLLFSFKRKKR